MGMFVAAVNIIVFLSSRAVGIGVSLNERPLVLEQQNEDVGRSPMMRKENMLKANKAKFRADSVTMGAEGELSEMRPGSMLEARSETHSQDHDDTYGEDADTDMCNDDFPLGNEGVPKCGDANADYSQILQEHLCIEAGRQANATVAHLKFKLTWEWFEKRPRGCFKYNCAEDPKGVCYFFNPIGDEPLHPTGTPVCSRPRYLNATSVDGTNGVKCPDQYQKIDGPTEGDEDACQEAATCLGYCEGTEFREAIQNASMYDEFPLGCFIHEQQGCVFYNPPQAAGTALPKSPVGVPICNVSSVTYFVWEDGKDYVGERIDLHPGDWHLGGDHGNESIWNHTTVDAQRELHQANKTATAAAEAAAAAAATPAAADDTTSAATPAAAE